MKYIKLVILVIAIMFLTGMKFGTLKPHYPYDVIYDGIKVYSATSDELGQMEVAMIPCVQTVQLNEIHDFPPPPPPKMYPNNIAPYYYVSQGKHISIPFDILTGNEPYEVIVEAEDPDFVEYAVAKHKYSSGNYISWYILFIPKKDYYGLLNLRVIINLKGLKETTMTQIRVCQGDC